MYNVETSRFTEALLYDAHRAGFTEFAQISENNREKIYKVSLHVSRALVLLAGSPGNSGR